MTIDPWSSKRDRDIIADRNRSAADADRRDQARTRRMIQRNLVQAFALKEAEPLPSSLVDLLQKLRAQDEQPRANARTLHGQN